MIELLAVHNADATLRDAEGPTPLDLLRQSSQAAISVLKRVLGEHNALEQQEEDDQDKCSICLDDLETEEQEEPVVTTAC